LSNTCGYQLVTIGSDGEPEFDNDGQPIGSGEVVELPVGAWGRAVSNPKRDEILLTTERGRNYIYVHSELGDWTLPFDLLPDQLDIFRALDAAVGGNADPFLFTFDVDASPQTWHFVRKDPDFVEGEEIAVKVAGVIVRRVRHILHITEEPTGTEVTV
jgi:hypothetical protein